MNAIPVIGVFDIGRTNKKLFLFDESYQIVFERFALFSEVSDQDGFPCENLESLRQFVFDSINEISRLREFRLKAINFSAYGASFVCLDSHNQAVCPLYNYLKPYPKRLSDEFYAKNNGIEEFSLQTSSPALGSLNSGLQLYRLKHEWPEVFMKIKHALHLPQYFSFLITGKYHTDLTSLGCHTAMWDFEKQHYHEWIFNEVMDSILAPIVPSADVIDSTFANNALKVGVGLHDSSAALIPYLINFSEPFILLSTGTWCISLNPFNLSPLTSEELKHDCLQYLQYQGKPVKASRLFSGHTHDEQMKRIAAHFDCQVNHFKNLIFDPGINLRVKSKLRQNLNFAKRNLAEFNDADEAYYQLISDLVGKQVASTQLVLRDSAVKRIYVDGGFSKNSIFMHMLAAAFSGLEIYAAQVAQASALGAALVIHDDWNTRSIPNDIIQVKYFSSPFQADK